MASNPCDNRAADGSATTLSFCRVNEPRASTQWTYQQPNEISSFGATLDTVARQPLSLDRAARKGTITSLSAEVGFTADQFVDNLAYFLDAFVFSTWKGNNPNAALITSAADDGYIVPAGGAAYLPGDLIYVKGFNLPVNNGLKVVGTGSTANKIAVENLAPEAGVPGALYRAGRRLAPDTVTIGVNGELLASADGVKFDTLGLTKGQYVAIKGVSADYDGTARIVSIAASQLTLDNFSAGSVTNTAPTGTVDLYFGSFVRSVAIDSPDYQCTPFTAEARYNTNPVTHEYARGVLANQIAFNNSLEDKSTLELTFIAEDVEPMTETRLPGVWGDYSRSEAFNTATDFADLRLRIPADPTGTTTYFKDTTLTVNNNLSGESVLGKLGPEFINLGNFEVTLDTEVVLTDTRVAAAVRNNTTCSLEYVQVNNEGALVVDLPTITIGDGGKNIAANEKVKLTTACTAFLDDKVGYVIGFSLFPYMPRF